MVEDLLFWSLVALAVVSVTLFLILLFKLKEVSEEVRAQGARAAELGVEASDNPHNPFEQSWLFNEWLAGYLHRKHELRKMRGKDHDCQDQ